MKQIHLYHTTIIIPFKQVVFTFTFFYILLILLFPYIIIPAFFPKQNSQNRY